MKHKARLSLILALVLAVFAGCAPAPAPAPESPPTEAPAVETASSEASETLELTLEELAQYNGKDGQRAYVAIDGIVYDVTDVPPWSGGIHQNKFEAGKDHTETIKNSPHGTKVLEKLKVVGKIKQ